MRGCIFMVIVISIVIFISSCSADYEQVVIAQAVKDTPAALLEIKGNESLASTGTSDAASGPSTTTITSTTTSTMPATTTSTSTTIPMTKKDEALYEKKNAYLIDLTQLNLQNCGEAILYFERGIEGIQKVVRNRKEDLESEEAKLGEARARYEEYRVLSNEAMMEAENRKIKDAIDRKDSLEMSIKDNESYLQEAEITLREIKDECRRIEAMAASALG